MGGNKWMNVLFILASKAMHYVFLIWETSFQFNSSTKKKLKNDLRMNSLWFKLAYLWNSGKKKENLIKMLLLGERGSLANHYRAKL